MLAQRVFEVSSRYAVRPLTRLATLLLLSSCDSEERRAAKSEVGRLDSSQVAALVLDSAGAIPLRGAGKDAAVEVTSLQATSHALYVIDEGAQAVRKYDRSGRLVFSVPSGRKSGGPLVSPEALAVRGDSLFVMDMKPSRGITILGTDGKVIGHVNVPSPASLATLAPTATGFAVTSIGLESSVVEGTATFLWTLGADGSVQPVGCSPDPIYAVSLRKRGFLGLFRNVGVSVNESRLYCRQPVSPVVQVFTLSGDSLPSIKVIPPFYRMGADAPQSMNQLTVNQFTSTWTEHLDFHPFGNGFLSVYAHFDVKRNARVYSLFRCVGDTGPSGYRCGTTEMTRRPLAFIAPDTIVTVELAEASVVARLSRIK